MKTKNIIIIFLLILVLVLAGVFVLTAKNKPAKVLSEIDALTTIFLEYPDLAKYQTTSLPPSSIEKKQAPDGWYFGFIERGSGLPGILTAKCYLVNNNKNITQVGEFKKDLAVTVEAIMLETCKPADVSPIVTPVTPLPPVVPIKSSGLAIGEIGTFNEISIRPLEVIEESRCPIDVTCIQAGTVRVKIDVITKSGTSASIVKLGQEFTTANVRIILTDVKPVPNSKINIKSSDYRFEFKVTKQSEPTPISKGKCFIGGCSGQLCSDTEGMASTCEFREEYACFKTAQCQRQADGKCGWTQTPELNKCLGLN